MLAVAVRVDVHCALGAVRTIGHREQLLAAAVDTLALRHARRVHRHHRGGSWRAAATPCLDPVGGPGHKKCGGCASRVTAMRPSGDVSADRQRPPLRRSLTWAREIAKASDAALRVQISMQVTPGMQPRLKGRLDAFHPVCKLWNEIRRRQATLCLCTSPGFAHLRIAFPTDVVVTCHRQFAVIVAIRSDLPALTQLHSPTALRKMLCLRDGPAWAPSRIDCIAEYQAGTSSGTRSPSRVKLVADPGATFQCGNAPNCELHQSVSSADALTSEQYRNSK